jgi:ribosome-associated protein
MSSYPQTQMTPLVENKKVRFQDRLLSMPDDSISLSNALKLSGIAQTGGQAKLLIQTGQVKVNGTIETRRKRKLHEGDVLEVNGEEFVVELSAED